MKKIRAAVVGYGNIGRYTVESLEAAPDFEIAGVVRRQGDKDKPLELTPYEVVDDITKLKEVDVAFLCTPTRSCPDYAERLVALGINTVDSFDIHTSILEYRTRHVVERVAERKTRERAACAAVPVGGHCAAHAWQEGYTVRADRAALCLSVHKIIVRQAQDGVLVPSGRSAGNEAGVLNEPQT